MSTGWEWVEAGLRLAREAGVLTYREVPEDIKYCPICNEYILLPDDESIHGPMNLVYRQVCPICADEYPDAYMELSKRTEVVGDAN